MMRQRSWIPSKRIVVWPAGREPNLDVAMETAQNLDEQRRQLPDQPGVYMFKDADGGVLYVGKATSIRKRGASHFSGPPRGRLHFIHPVASLDFLVPETAAEAPLAH